MARSRGLDALVTVAHGASASPFARASRRALFALVALSALAGCAPGSPSLIVLHQVAPSDECTWDPAGGVFIVAPRFDIDPLTPEQRSDAGLGPVPTYVAHLAVENHIRSRYSNSFPVQADPNTIAIQAAEVELLGANGQRLPAGFYRTRASGTIPSAAGESPGLGLATVDVIPGSVSAGLADAFAGASAGEGLVTASVVLIGVTGGATEVRSGPFIIPLEICYGCLYVDHVPATGEVVGCSPGQDAIFALPGFSKTPICASSDECASGLCTVGRCARDLP